MGATRSYPSLEIHLCYFVFVGRGAIAELRWISMDQSLATDSWLMSLQRSLGGQMSPAPPNCRLGSAAPAAVTTRRRLGWGREAQRAEEG